MKPATQAAVHALLPWFAAQDVKVALTTSVEEEVDDPSEDPFAMFLREVAQ